MNSTWQASSSLFSKLTIMPNYCTLSIDRVRLYMCFCARVRNEDVVKIGIRKIKPPFINWWNVCDEFTSPIAANFWMSTEWTGIWWSNFTKLGHDCALRQILVITRTLFARHFLRHNVKGLGPRTVGWGVLCPTQHVLTFSFDYLKFFPGLHATGNLVVARWRSALWLANDLYISDW